MAHGKSLILRDIQPRLRWRGYEPNPYRVHTRAAAKAARVSRRRWLKATRRAARRG